MQSRHFIETVNCCHHISFAISRLDIHSWKREATHRRLTPRVIMHIYTTHIYMYTYVRTYVRTYTHTKDHTSLSHPPCVVLHTYAYINLCIYTFMQTKIHTSIRSLIAITPYLVWLCTHIRTYMHTCIHIYIRLNIRTDRHTYSARKQKVILPLI